MLYYIHGYASGPNSAKGILFKEKLGAIPVKWMVTRLMWVDV